MSGEGRENLIAEARRPLTVEEVERHLWNGGRVKTEPDGSVYAVEGGLFFVSDFAYAIRAESSRPRLIETVEELDALPERSIVLDRDGDVWQSRGVWWCSYETASVGSPRLLKKHGPLRLVFEPGKEQS